MNRNRNRKKNVIVDVARAHQLNIARRTMSLTCVGAAILGGMNHAEAARLLGTTVPQGCTCEAKS